MPAWLVDCLVSSVPAYRIVLRCVQAEKIVRLKKGVECVLTAMTSFSGDEDVQYQCCYTVAAFARLGGVDMFNALQRHGVGEMLLKVNTVCVVALNTSKPFEDDDRPKERAPPAPAPTHHKPTKPTLGCAQSVIRSLNFLRASHSFVCSTWCDMQALAKFALSEKGILWTCCLALKQLAESNRGNLRALRKLKAAPVCVACERAQAHT